ncbi:MAG: SDR family oxidoreductase [Planctomycetaceae bacterium]|nr:SDR family oxidoreductase [Planctomycetaceae bacterium]
MSTLSKKVAIVTGASRGIGFGLALALLKEGCRVVICSRREDQIQSAAEELVSRAAVPAGFVFAVAADVGVESDVERLFASTVERFGCVDLVINNAGNFDGGPIESLTMEEWENVLGACLTGPFLCTREAFRLMKPRRSGRVLNIGSISAQRARMHSVPYTSAKFGVQGLTHAAALEGREFGIIVSCLHPGNVSVERRCDSDAESDREPMMSVQTIVKAAMAMLTMPDDVNFLDAIVLPSKQDYIGRG